MQSATFPTEIALPAIDWSSTHTYLSVIFFLGAIVLVVLQPPIPVFPRSCCQSRNRSQDRPDDSKVAPVQDTPNERPITGLDSQNGDTQHRNENLCVDDTKSVNLAQGNTIHETQARHDESNEGMARNGILCAFRRRSKIMHLSLETAQNRVQQFLYSHFFIMRLDLMWAPMLSLLVLLATGTCTLDILVVGIAGSEYVKSYSVLVLFMALSYMCISLDMSGIFRSLAHLIARKTGNRRWLMFLCFGAFSSLLTVFTSNDIVILTLTPIICYVYQQNKEEFDPLPFVFCQFFMANIWSITLMIGNPTNIIVAEAYQMNFVEYSAWMIIPAIVSGGLCFSLLSVIFNRRIRNPKKEKQKQIMAVVTESDEEIERTPLRDETDCTMDQNPDRHTYEDDTHSDTQMTYNPSLDPDLVEPALTLFPSGELNDVVEEELREEAQQDSVELREMTQEKEVRVVNGPQDPRTEKGEQQSRSYEHNQVLDKLSACVKVFGLASCLLTLTVVSFFAFPAWIVCLIFACMYMLYDIIRDTTMFTLYHVRRRGEKKEVGPTGLRKGRTKTLIATIVQRSVFIQTIIRMPWKVVPFALSLFIYVELLRQYRWVDGIAYVLVQTIEQVSFQSIKGDSFLFIFSSVLVMAIFSSLACNVLNNQPVTILFTTVMKSNIVEHYFLAKPHSMIAKHGALFSLIISSNFGANITIIGALAGIMWVQLLRQNQIDVGYWKFLKYGLLTIPLVILVMCLVLTAELMVVQTIVNGQTGVV